MATYLLNASKPAKASNKFRIGSLVNFLIGLVLLLVTAYLAHKHTMGSIQSQIFYDLNNPDLGGAFTTAAKWITEGLGAGYPIAVCVIVPLLFKKFRIAWRFLFTAAGAFLVAYVIKNIVNEPRPIAMLHSHLHQRVVETGPGFPSGHETAATALALTLWFILPYSWRWVSVLWILAVAWSRLYLGVHTPADVVGGFAIGLMAVSFVRLLPSSISKPLRLDY